MPETQRQERPEALRRDIAQSHPGGQYEAAHQHDTEPLDQVAETPGEGRREQADGCAGAQHEPQLRGWHSARVNQGWEKGRRHPEGGVQRGIEQEKGDNAVDRAASPMACRFHRVLAGSASAAHGVSSPPPHAVPGHAGPVAGNATVCSAGRGRSER